jgi:hypothetical protein
MRTEARYPHHVSEARLAAVTCGSIGGLTIGQIADEAAVIGIPMESETFARVRRGEVENPRGWTSMNIITVAHRIGVTPTNPFNVEQVCEAADLEAEHKWLEKNSGTPDRASKMALVRFKLCTRANSANQARRFRAKKFRNHDDEFGWVWFTTNDIMHAASVSHDAKDEEGLKQAIAMDVARAYVFCRATFRRLAKAIPSWPGFTTDSPPVVLRDQRGGIDSTPTLSRKRWLQYSIAVQNAAVADMNLHALGVINNDNHRISRSEASMRGLFKDFRLHSTFLFLDSVCEGTDLQRKYLRNRALCTAVTNDRPGFDKAVAMFKQRFKFDPVEKPTKVKGEEEYPALKSDPSVMRLLHNEGVVRCSSPHG